MFFQNVIIRNSKDPHTGETTVLVKKKIILGSNNSGCFKGINHFYGESKKKKKKNISKAETGS